MRSLAAHITGRLHALQANGLAKHLLLRTPAALGGAVGLAANATGPTWVPIHNGHNYYIGGLQIG